MSQIVVDSFEVYDVEDDLQLINGIGPVYEKKLREAGIKTYQALANLSDEEMHAIIQPSGRTPDYTAVRAAARELSKAAPEEA